jgi:hypothetical protein
MIHSTAFASYEEASTLLLHVTQAGPFPYRIIYMQQAGTTPGVLMRWRTPSHEGHAFSVVPAAVLFTDALLQRSELLAGSIAGARKRIHFDSASWC